MLSILEFKRSTAETTTGKSLNKHSLKSSCSAASPLLQKQRKMAKPKDNRSGRFPCCSVWLSEATYLRPWQTRTHCCGHKCFPVCPRAQHLLWTQILCPGHKKCFWFCSETLCVRNKCLPVCAAQETSWATMCPQQCVLVCQGFSHYISVVMYFGTLLKTSVVNTNLQRIRGQHSQTVNSWSANS